jgi:hypothetical protein
MRARPILWAVLLLVAGLAVAMSVGTAGASTRAGADQSWTDPVGDAQGGPDITLVAIHSDPSTRQITFTVTASGMYAAPSGALSHRVSLWIDTDKNPNTGDPQDGTEYGLSARYDSTGSWWGFWKWDGSQWPSVPDSPTVFFKHTGDVMTWTVNASDLGGATSFRFYVVARTFDPSGNTLVARDDAPDGDAWWEYDVLASTPPTTTTPTTPATTPTTPTTTTPAPTAPPAKILAVEISAPKTVPRYPIAGKRFTASFDVQVEKQDTATVIDITTGQPKGEATIVTWDPLLKGKMVCDPSVAGRVIPHTESFKAGKARLSFLVPKTAKGKQLKVKLTIKAEGKTATKIATFRVR